MNTTQARSAARMLALPALLGVALALSGCGMPFVKHRDSADVRAAKTAPDRSKPPKAKAKSSAPVAKAKAGRKAKKSAPAAEVADLPRHPKTVEELAQRAALEPGEPYWPYRLAVLHADAGSGELAERELRAALARDADYAPALSRLSERMYASGRHAEAIPMLESARVRASARPEGFAPELLVALALHQDAIGRPDLAKDLMGLLEHSDRHDAASAAAFLALRGEPSQAASDLAKEAVHEDGKSAANQNNSGIAKLRAGDVTGARKAFLAAIDRDAKLPGPYYNLAILEKFYVFDDAAAQRWFRLYRDRASDDPDGLAQVIGDGAAPNEKGGR